METPTVETELWVRFLPRHYSRLARADSNLSVIIPIHSRHIAKTGMPSQADLTGPGELDMKMVVPADETGVWAFERAFYYCVRQLNDFVAAQRDHQKSAYRHVIYECVEFLPDAFLGRPMVAPNGMIGQEIVLPQSLFESLIRDSEKNIDAYMILQEIGLQCLENGQIDMQPTHFRNWFDDVINGLRSRPGKRPEYWKNTPRDHMLFALIQNLNRHGINPARNDASFDESSGCDAVAKAAREAKLRGVTSYETVKKLYFKIQHA